MDILVADLDFTSRVPVETHLREHDHRVINLENGLDIAKLVAGGKAPRIAFLSNNLEKLRGVDVCRFLSALEKKQLVYVILLVEKADPQMLSRFRLAGVDDVLIKPIDSLALSTSLDLAVRIVQLEDELRLIRETFGKSLTTPGVLGERIARLKANNLALLKGKSDDAASGTKRKPDTKARPAEPLKPIKASNAFRPTEPKKVALAGGTSDSSPPGTNFLFQPSPGDGQPSVATTRESAPGSPVTSFAHAQDPLPSGSFSAGKQPPPPAEPTYEDVQSFAEAEQEEDLEEVLIHPFEFDELVLNVFSGMEVVLKPEIPPLSITPGNGVFLSWVGLVMPESKLWVDVLMVAPESAAQAVTNAILGEENPGDEDIMEMSAELLNMLQGSLKLHFEEKSLKLVQATIPQSRRESQLPSLPENGLEVDSGFSIGGSPVNLFFYRSTSLRKCRKAEDLKPFECVLTDLRGTGPDAQTLMKAGTILKENTIQAIAAQSPDIQPVELITPSSFSRELGFID